MSRFTIRSVVAAATALVLALGVSACGASSGTPAAGSSTKPLVIVADVTPHAVLLKEVQKQGLLGDVKIEIKEITAQIDPNQLVNAGDVDANFFQHVPYLTDWIAKHDKAPLVVVATTHVEPLGLYSKKVKTIAETPEKAVIAIPSDATNQARALFLIADAGLITLNVKPTDANLDFSQVTPKNVTANPKNVTFINIDRPQLAATLSDPKVTLSIINGNYALEAGLTPSKDALKLETAVNNPYANVLVVKDSLKNDPRVVKLAEALQSPKIATFIDTEFKGSVLPAKKG